jgi:hypothetical protein
MNTLSGGCVEKRLFAFLWIAVIFAVPPAFADESLDSYMKVQEILSSATSDSDLDKAREYFTGDALKAFDKVRKKGSDGTLHDDPLKYLQMMFQTAGFPPTIDSQTSDGTKATVGVSGTAAFATYGTAAGAPVKAMVSLVNEDGRWKINDLKSTAGGMHIWTWYGIELDK